MKQGILFVFVVSLCLLSCQTGPEAIFRMSKGSCDAPCQVTFTSVSEDATVWRWDFDNGQTQELNFEIPVTVTYQTPGLYDITLTVFDAEFNQDQFSRTLEVR